MLKAIIIILIFITQSYAQIQNSSFYNKNNQKEYLKTMFKSGSHPKGLDFIPGTQSFYVANLATYRFDRYDPNQEVQNSYSKKSIRLPKGISRAIEGYAEALVTRDGRFVLASRPDGCDNCQGRSSEVSSRSIIAVIDTQSNKTVEYIPAAPGEYTWGSNGSKMMAQHTAPGLEKIIYVTNYFTHDVSVISLESSYHSNNQNLEDNEKLNKSSLIKNIKLRTGKEKISPRGVDFFANGRYAIILGATSRKVYILDAINHTLILELPQVINPTTGSTVNFRHIAIDKNRNQAYFSNMKGNSISRIDLNILESHLDTFDRNNKKASEFLWEQILIPWKDKNGQEQKFLIINDYNLKSYSGKYGNTDPNTIELDPIEGRYLFVSCRSGNINGTKSLPNSKVDVIDTYTDKRVFQLEAGRGATALSISSDGKTLVSSAFYDSELWVYDIEALIKNYKESREK